MISATEERIKTNKLLMDICNFNKDLFDTSTLSSDEIRYYNKITDGFNKQIQFFIDWLDSDEAKRIFQDYTRYNDQAFKEIDEYTQDIIEDTKLTSDEIINKIYDTGLTNGYQEIRRTKYYNDATKYGLKFLQEYNFSLINNLNEDLKKHIKTQIFNGIVAGETMPEVAQKILHAHETSLTGKTLSARQRAMMIARTETARAMTQGRLQSYANYGVQEVKILTAGDNSVCAICRESADKIYPIEEASNLVPFHPLCRCSVTAYIRHGILVGKPLENPEFMDCTPSEKNDKVEKPEIKWTCESLRKQLTNIADPEDIDQLTDALMDYMYGLKNKNKEVLSAVDNNFNLVCNHFPGTSGGVYLCPKGVNASTHAGLFMVIHNHPSDNPLHSSGDIKGFAKYEMKYNIVFTEKEGLFIFKNNGADSYDIYMGWNDTFEKMKTHYKSYHSEEYQKIFADYEMGIIPGRSFKNKILHNVINHMSENIEVSINAFVECMGKHNVDVTRILP